MKQVAVIYDNTIRTDTTGIYVERALRQVADVVHFLPTQMDRIQPEYDLYLQVDDGLTYRWVRSDLHPSAWWIIDTHLQFDWDKEKAVDFDFLFTAQKDGAERLKFEGFDNAKWLPLGCDPEIHCRIPNVKKQYNVCFVGSLIPGRRTELIELLKDEVPRVHVTQAYFEEMAKIYTQSKIIFNCSVKNDVNMRVFEAISSGSLLITNNIKGNGQEEIFIDGQHLVTYSSANELLDRVRFYLKHEDKREAIAQRGMELAHKTCTYRHRVESILSQFDRNVSISVPELYTTNAQTSIIVVVHNVLEMTKQCIESVLQHTSGIPFELIFVNNGSTDGTLEWLESLVQLHNDINIKIISNPDNRGFPKAVNQGFMCVDEESKFILLLNNDTIVTHDWLRRMLRVFTEDARVGIVGPGSNNCSGMQQVGQVVYTDDKSLQQFAENFYRVYRTFSVEVDRLVGFCMLIRRALIEEIGTFDEDFGIGNFEDDDFCTRAAAAKWTLRIAGDVFIHHFGQQTFHVIEADYDRLMQENWMKYLLKYPDGGIHKESLGQQTSSKNVQSLTAHTHPTVTN